MITPRQRLLPGSEHVTTQQPRRRTTRRTTTTTTTTTTTQPPRTTTLDYTNSYNNYNIDRKIDNYEYYDYEDNYEYDSYDQIQENNQQSSQNSRSTNQEKAKINQNVHNYDNIANDINKQQKSLDYYDYENSQQNLPKSDNTLNQREYINKENESKGNHDYEDFNDHESDEELSWIQDSAKNLEKLLSLIKGYDVSDYLDKDIVIEHTTEQRPRNKKINNNQYRNNVAGSNDLAADQPANLNVVDLPADLLATTEGAWMGNSIVGTSLATDFR